MIDAIESKTPMKVLSDPDGADTELQGTVIRLDKLLDEPDAVQRGPRAATLPGRRDRLARPAAGMRREDPDQPATPRRPAPAARHRVRPGQPADRRPARTSPRPAVITTAGRGMPELGETSTTALHMAVNRMAVKIVSAMEQPW